MKQSLTTNIIQVYFGIFSGYCIALFIFKREFNFVEFLLALNLLLCCIALELIDKISHLYKLNEVHKQQLRNRRVFDEINKLNFKFNESFKKTN